MKIELCEDNGFLNNGKPTLVVLVIDDKTRIPYEATKTIQELYVDVAKLAPAECSVVKEEIVSEPVAVVESKDIEREDIVKCVRLEKDLDGNVNEEIEIGKEYRVIDIIKAQGKLVCYEVLDDSKNDKIRIPIRPDEVELVRKHFKKKPRRQSFEIIKKCAECKEENPLWLNDTTGQYEGECSKCGCKLVELRAV